MFAMEILRWLCWVQTNLRYINSSVMEGLLTNTWKKYKNKRQKTVIKMAKTLLLAWNLHRPISRFVGNASYTVVLLNSSCGQRYPNLVDDRVTKKLKIIKISYRKRRWYDYCSYPVLASTDCSSCWQWVIQKFCCTRALGADIHSVTDGRHISNLIDWVLLPFCAHHVKKQNSS
jgi:hypothetical protein